MRLQGYGDITHTWRQGVPPKELSRLALRCSPPPLPQASDDDRFRQRCCSVVSVVARGALRNTGRTSNPSVVEHSRCVPHGFDHGCICPPRPQCALPMSAPEALPRVLPSSDCPDQRRSCGSHGILEWLGRDSLPHSMHTITFIAQVPLPPKRCHSLSAGLMRVCSSVGVCGIKPLVYACQASASHTCVRRSSRVSPVRHPLRRPIDGHSG